MPALPVNLTIQPASQHWHGHPVHVRVIDDGTLPLHVTASGVLLHHHCAMSAQAGITVTPSSFTLAPGQAVTTVVSVPNARGDYGAQFSALAAGPHGSVSLAGSVGSQILAGNAVSCAPPRTAPHTAAAGFPMLPVTLAAIVLFIAGSACWLTVWRMRRRGRA